MDLVLLVCLAASPATCREERLLVSYEQSDPRACMAGAMPIVAEWAGDHPEYTIARWSCGAAGTSKVTRNFN